MKSNVKMSELNEQLSENQNQFMDLLRNNAKKDINNKEFIKSLIMSKIFGRALIFLLSDSGWAGRQRKSSGGSGRTISARSTPLVTSLVVYPLHNQLK